MAQKAAKSTARRNTSILNRTHSITAAVHAVFLALRLFLRFHGSPSLPKYIILSGPALFIEFWLERIGRPSYGSGTGATELKRSGEDLEAKGLTEYMWDVLYWTWGCIAAVALLGDWAWWFWIVVPMYSVWLAWTTFGGMKAGLGGLAGGASTAGVGEQTSNRQKKLEKRGGQKAQYR